MSCLIALVSKITKSGFLAVDDGNLMRNLNQKNDLPCCYGNYCATTNSKMCGHTGGGHTGGGHTGGVVTQEVVTQEVVTQEVVTQEVVTQEVVTQEVVTQEVVIQEGGKSNFMKNFLTNPIKIRGKTTIRQTHYIQFLI